MKLGRLLSAASLLVAFGCKPAGRKAPSEEVQSTAPAAAATTSAAWTAPVQVGGPEFAVFTLAGAANGAGVLIGESGAKTAGTVLARLFQPGTGWQPVATVGQCPYDVGKLLAATDGAGNALAVWSCYAKASDEGRDVAAAQHLLAASHRSGEAWGEAHPLATGPLWTFDLVTEPRTGHVFIWWMMGAAKPWQLAGSSLLLGGAAAPAAVVAAVDEQESGFALSPSGQQLALVSAGSAGLVLRHREQGSWSSPRSVLGREACSISGPLFLADGTVVVAGELSTQAKCAYAEAASVQGFVCVVPVAAGNCVLRMLGAPVHPWKAETSEDDGPKIIQQDPSGKNLQSNDALPDARLIPIGSGSVGVLWRDAQNKPHLAAVAADGTVGDETPVPTVQLQAQYGGGQVVWQEEIGAPDNSRDVVYQSARSVTAAWSAKSLVTPAYSSVQTFHAVLPEAGPPLVVWYEEGSQHPGLWSISRTESAP